MIPLFYRIFWICQSFYLLVQTSQPCKYDVNYELLNYLVTTSHSFELIITTVTRNLLIDLHVPAFKPSKTTVALETESMPANFVPVGWTILRPSYPTGIWHAQSINIGKKESRPLAVLISLSIPYSRENAGPYLRMKRNVMKISSQWKAGAVRNKLNPRIIPRHRPRNRWKQMIVSFAGMGWSMILWWCPSFSTCLHLYRRARNSMPCKYPYADLDVCSLLAPNLLHMFNYRDTEPLDKFACAGLLSFQNYCCPGPDVFTCDFCSSGLVNPDAMCSDFQSR